MTWKEKTLCRILLIIAKMIAPGALQDDITHLRNHISVYRGENEHD